MRLQEDELRKYFERHKDTWEPTARKTDVFAEKTWQLSQRSTHEGTTGALS